MSDLVLAVEKALADRWRDEQLRNDSDPEVDAYVALPAIHDADWRIVRAEHVQYMPLNPDIERVNIIEEWTP